MRDIKYNTDEWPLVLVDFPQEINRETMEQYFTCEAESLARQQPYVEILLIAGGMKQEARELVSTKDREHAAQTRRFVKGKAFVFRSRLGRAVFSAIGMFFPYPFPHKVFDSEQTARIWARQQLIKQSDSGHQALSL